MANVTMRGNPVTLLGNEVKPGQQAPDFTAVKNDLSPFSFRETSGVRLIISVPSVDTGVCDAEVRRFNEEAASLNATVIAVSMDLPFAQKRWCGAAGVDKVEVVSDHRDASFGQAYGCLIDGLRLLARAVFVVDSSNTVTYVEYVPEVSSHPNYEAALEAVKAAK